MNSTTLNTRTIQQPKSVIINAKMAQLVPKMGVVIVRLGLLASIVLLVSIRPLNSIFIKTYYIVFEFLSGENKTLD